MKNILAYQKSIAQLSKKDIMEEKLAMIVPSNEEYTCLPKEYCIAFQRRHNGEPKKSKFIPKICKRQRQTAITSGKA